jgi:hypothetical protein
MWTCVPGFWATVSSTSVGQNTYTHLLRSNRIPTCVHLSHSLFAHRVVSYSRKPFFRHRSLPTEQELFSYIYSFSKLVQNDEQYFLLAVNHISDAVPQLKCVRIK